LLLGGFFLITRKQKASAPLRRIALLSSPLSVLLLVPSLFQARLWSAQPLPYLLQLSLTTLAFERTLRWSLAALPPTVSELFDERQVPLWARRWLPLGVVIAGALGYSIYFSYYTILNHHRLGTSAFDLGINVNWCYNALKGYPFRTTVLFGPGGGNMISGHAIFGMLFLWLPFFAISPTAETLLIYQSAIVGLAAIPLYLFASTQIPRVSAVLVAFCYLLYAPLHGPNFYDFHELLPPIFFHFLLYYAIATRRNWLTVLTVFIVFSCREDIPVGVAVLGIYLLVTGVRPRLGTVLAIVSVAWFLIDKFVLMPMAGKWWFARIYEELIPAGESGYGAIVQTILVNPVYFLGTLIKEAKLTYALHMLAPLLFLPLRRWSVAILLVPGFFFTLMTTGYTPTVSIAFHYTAHWIPYLFLGVVLVLRALSSEPLGNVKRRAALGAMALALLSHSYVFGAVLQRNTFVGGFSKIQFHITEAEKKRLAELRRLGAMVPRNASLAATEREVPHLAARVDAYALRDHHGDAEYLLINKQQMSFGNTRRTVQDAFKRGSYGLLDAGDVFYLFKKNHSSPDTAAALNALGIMP
ncbi:MAG: DUF2079 domain-containing protein, partial [Myxococcales bacterium]|nr:DUF2079 domain-containing protein [Polyangiaceae bacterium]MDW8249673.1 DUF2079 domain-containing protein [Myxococcales bacterium]